MSIIKSKRNKSKVEFLHNLEVMTRNVNNIVINKFGFNYDKCIKDIKSEFGNKSENEMNSATLGSYLKKISYANEMNNVIIPYYQHKVLDYCDKVRECVYIANGSFVDSEVSYNKRISYQRDAMAYCFSLLNSIQNAITILNSSLNRYTQQLQTIRKEMGLIKAWRKSTTNSWKK